MSLQFVLLLFFYGAAVRAVIALFVLFHCHTVKLSHCMVSAMEQIKMDREIRDHCWMLISLT